jgi:AcrR family transcriptional regulator
MSSTSSQRVPDRAGPEVPARLKDPSLLEQRRRELVEVATEVVVEKGFDKASVNEIAERWGQSVGGLYRYVRTKDDILVLVCAEIFRRIGPDALDAPDVDDPAERFRLAFTAYCTNIHRHARQVLLMYREYGRLSPEARAHFMDQESQVAGVFRAIVEDGVERGVFRCEDPELFGVDCVTRAHSLALKGWALESRTPEEVIATITSWAVRSLGGA